MTTQREAGVDITAGNEAVERIKKKVSSTFRYAPGKVLSGIGGFGAIIEHTDGTISGYATDGVGTKLLIASLLGVHKTVGIDLVAMCANDLAAVGVPPKVFLDYIAMGRQIPERTEAIVSGIVEGCKQAQMALVGGEMAELPGMLDTDHYDLAGFAAGFGKSRDELILGEQVKAGMYVYGVPSSGVHANGFSLIRRVFELDIPGQHIEVRRRLERHYHDLGYTLGDELLKPTRIYVKLIKHLRVEYLIKGLVHITGGGFIDNPPRVMPEGLSVQIDLSTWEIPPIFHLIQKVGNVSHSEMLGTFNLGIGLLIISPDEIRNQEIVKIGEVVESAAVKQKGSKTLFVGGQHLI